MPRAGPAAALPTPGRTAPPRRGDGGRRLLVRLLKRLLPAAAIVLLAAIALWPQWQGSEDGRRYTFRLGTDLLSEPMRMRDARFRGIDELGRPYTITASQAMQQGNAEGVIDLAEPKADMLLQDGGWVLLQAAGGQYRRDPGELDLSGGVVLNHDGGYEVRTERATIDLKAQSARGDRPVEGQGPFGTIAGQGFEATEGGKVIVVTGPATLVLQGEEARP